MRTPLLAALALVAPPPAWEPPRILPAAWTPLKRTIGEAGETLHWYRRRDGLAVAAAVEPHESGAWLHVSLSRGNRLPSWDDIRDVKDLFVGKDRVAVQMLPRPEEYVNHHPHTMHLWCGLDGQQVVPDDAMPRGGP